MKYFKGNFERQGRRFAHHWPFPLLTKAAVTKKQEPAPKTDNEQSFRKAKDHVEAGHQYSTLTSQEETLENPTILHRTIHDKKKHRDTIYAKDNIDRIRQIRSISRKSPKRNRDF